jgi:transcriptional regulator with XRE-family HTH domain
MGPLMSNKSGQIRKRPHRKDPVVRAAFARILVEKRRELHRKQHEIASKSGYSEKYIGQLERRLNTPSLTAMIEISSALDLDPRDTLSRVLDLMPRFKRLEKSDKEAADL